MSTENRDEILVEAVVKTVRPMVKALVSALRAHFLQEAREQVEEERMECCNGIGGHKTGCQYEHNPYEELAKVLCDADGTVHGWESISERGRDVHRDMARAAHEHIEAQQEDAVTYERERAEKAEAEMRAEVAEHDKTRAAVLRLTRERDEAERRRIVEDKRIRQLEAQVEAKRAKYDDLLDRIRAAHKVAAFHAEMIQSGDPDHRDCAAHSAETLAALLPEDEQ